MSIVMRSRYSSIDSVSVGSFEVSKTQQHFAHDCNIHEIVVRSKKGMMPIQKSNNAPFFGDFSIVNDYQSACEQLAISEDAFMALPAEVRRRFNDRPSDLIDFVSDVANKDEAIKLGLVSGPKPPEVNIGDELKAIADGLRASKGGVPPAASTVST